MRRIEKQSQWDEKLWSYLLVELRNPMIYLSSLVIGCAISLLSGAFTLAPFYVPLLVQSITRAILRYNNRRTETLAQMSSRRSDPAFIINREGKIILSAGGDESMGWTKITHLDELIDAETTRAVVANATGGETITAFAPMHERWYELHAKPLGAADAQADIVVWLIDVTDRKINDRLLSSFIDYSRLLIADLDEVIRERNVPERLALFFLDHGFGAIFITRCTNGKELVGRVFVRRPDGSLAQSDEIAVAIDSDAPVARSRKSGEVVCGDINDYGSREEFENIYRFDSRVATFVGEPIVDCVNYHEEDLSIILFNREAKALGSERRVVAALLNLSRTIMRLVDLAGDHNTKTPENGDG